MDEELGHCTNAECLALINTTWGGYSEPLLCSFRADTQCLVPVKGGGLEQGALTVGRAGGDVAGAVDGPFACAVPPVVPGGWVVAVAIGKLNSPSTGTGALSPGAPGSPVAMA